MTMLPMMTGCEPFVRPQLMEGARAAIAVVTLSVTLTPSRATPRHCPAQGLWLLSLGGALDIHRGSRHAASPPARSLPRLHGHRRRRAHPVQGVCEALHLRRRQRVLPARLCLAASLTHSGCLITGCEDDRAWRRAWRGWSGESEKEGAEKKISDDDGRRRRARRCWIKHIELCEAHANEEGVGVQDAVRQV